jgi:hypothetical protein
MTLKPKDPITGSRSGAFMGEAAWQSQPTGSAEWHAFAAQIAIIGNP